MKALTEKILHYVVLILVTVFAVAVMWKLSAKEKLTANADAPALRDLSPISAPKAPVAVAPLQVQMCEVISTHAGKIQPWETYQIGFPISGRVISLGTNAEGQQLDDGDQVEAGQMLATMDDRVFRAQKSEAAARIEQVTSDLQRAQQARKTNRRAVTDAELQKWVTDLALARAQYDVAVKNLDDATLRSPVDATISKRMTKPGESVSPNQVVFELVENEDVLLMVDVPETQIRELEERMRAVAQYRRDPNAEEADKTFYAHIHLEGRDRFGNPWPSLDGEVYRIPEIAEPRTGLFAVEIRIPNPDRLLRPGMVATADIVTARIPGYPVPQAAVIFRQRNAYLFTVDRQPAEMEMLFWDVGETSLYRARRIDLSRWIDQGAFVIVPENEANLQSVITRGQYRLANQQAIRIMNLEQLSPGLMTTTAEIPQVAAEPGISQ